VNVVTWNVNSIRARLDRVLSWLGTHQPDVVCLQELKTDTPTFPRAPLEGLGYTVAHACQKTYNGVAILSRGPLENVQVGLQDEEEDPQARFVAADTLGTRVLCAYVPNGQAVGSEKYAYKLRWLDRLRRHLDEKCRPGDPLVLCGDFNVAPAPLDVHDPAAWEGETLFHPSSRAALQRVTAWGLTDTFRMHNPGGGLYSWWDYRMAAFPKNHGLRIDLVLTTESMARRCRASSIDREERRGPQPSDHAPVVVTFD
jgi:exodeoxyribonuclease-3